MTEDIKCKVCKCIKDCNVCYDCYWNSVLKVLSEEKGKDVLLRLERKLDILREEITILQKLFNTKLYKKDKIIPSKSYEDYYF